MSMLQKIFGQIETNDPFEALRITVASPDEIKSWSYGEVKKPDTIDYHSLRPEPEGLFCQQIFGPQKDYECACGKYKRIKFRGVVCERCGVEVGASSVRRERMGHIKLITPVVHNWFMREGKIATLLNNMPNKKLDQVISYDNYIVAEPGLTDLRLYDVISEDDYQKKIEEFGADSFRVGIGAEGVRNIIAALDMVEERNRLRAELADTKSDVKRRSLQKHLRLVENFVASGVNPSWMIMDTIPVLPPELRPLVQLDAGHVATSDLNDLYRRVIIRNNRLKKLIEMRAPEIIVRNEKRMLQEAVDALFDNSHKPRPMVSQNKHVLKSLSDSLRGKSGRFRMNLLGKRVDYSGRSVIVSGPTLRLHQVGLPKIMALELFRLFVYAELLAMDHANTLKTAKKMVENQEAIVWDILQKVIYQHPVILNRAPTLHKLSVLAFEPILVEGKAIQLHPLVCKGFNADFDGDTMSVHVPISLEAQLEARTLMLATNNVLHPADGAPVIVPSQDMVLGVYYISLVNGDWTQKSPRFANMDEIKMALQNEAIELHTPIIARFNEIDMDGNVAMKTFKTTAGRMILGEILPKKPGMSFALVNQDMKKGKIEELLASAYEFCGDKDMIIVADKLKNIGFEQAAKSGISISQDDIVIPEGKAKLIEAARKSAGEIEGQYQNGLISNGERYNKVVDLWQKTTDSVGALSLAAMEKSSAPGKWNSISMMADSGARGSQTQIRQLAGMRGMMTKPSGEIIEVPIISNFKEGLNVSEYFTSTHGSRKGLSDTAMKTAEAGYLTRRLVSLAQNIVITETDCGTTESVIERPIHDGATIVKTLGKVVMGRFAAEDVKNAAGDAIVKRNELITKQIASKIDAADLKEIKVRSVLTCESEGLCAKCYGSDLSKGTQVQIGEGVGIIAAQAIGEPGTQLTLRTFHVGGVAVSSGGNEGFVVAPVAGKAEFENVGIVVNSRGKNIVMGHNAYVKIGNARVKLPYSSEVAIVDGAMVEKGAKIAETDPYSRVILAEKSGKVAYRDLIDNISYKEEEDSVSGISTKKIINWKNITKKSLKPGIAILDDAGEIITMGKNKLEYMMPIYAVLNVSDGDDIKAGDVIARIPVENQKTKDITGGLPRVEELLEARNLKNPAVLADIDGEIEIDDSHKSKIMVRILPADAAEKPVEYMIPKGSNILVNNGDVIKKADFIVGGDPVPEDILRISGRKALATYMVDQVQQVYRLQGVSINNKHMEIIIREMMRKVEIIDPKDTTFMHGQEVNIGTLRAENKRVASDGKKPALYKHRLMGISKLSRSSDSFISNAAFQEVTRVLTDAAIRGQVDRLEGLNENLIVGRLIPLGTGTYVRRVREIAEAEEASEVAKIEEGVPQQGTLDL
ncbi:MAG: DNA-directed RNA polymerase subunit beta' [Rickettsiales bacterium]|jgi:DNA-directed RNA polymerase subunit beta'|nr:DNA-directed RNA polymerase subunit beta' [Rickettsiales bacterium]